MLLYKLVEINLVSGMEDYRATFFFCLLLAITVLNPPQICVLAQRGEALSLGDSLTGNHTLISKNGTFALGFFSPGETNKWYMGIWFAKVPARTVVWVANRETPLKNTPGILKLSIEGQLGLFDADGVSVWWINGTNKASGAVLTDSGNFVLLGKSESVWESIDYPTDTWLPGMKIGAERKLVSWKNSVDPSAGPFSAAFETNSSGVGQVVLRWNHSVPYWTTGAWDGKTYVGIPEMSGKFSGEYTYNFYTGKSNYNFSMGQTGVYFSYTTPDGVIPLVVIDKAGGFTLSMLIDGSRWNLFWFQPRDQCQVYGLCGAFGVCNSKSTPFCTCQRGYEPRDQKAWDSQEWWSSGCVRSSKGRRFLWIAIVVVVAVVCAIVLASLLFWRRRSNFPKEVDATPSIRMFSYKELQISTTNFSHKLGSGAFGSVFRGTLPDGSLVAVKKLEGAGQGEKQFRAEINTVGNIHHVNLIRLRGFCAEKTRRLLVYDYMPSGSLNAFLFGKNEGRVEDWKTRFEIAVGVARGLVYLHEECEKRIIHCDVKPENILLDTNLCPKLADFGLAKLLGRDFSRVLTTTRGTRGYLAPEWISGLPITSKADVYSYGMTLLEIISGRRNLDLEQEASRIYFPTWAATQIHKGDVMSAVDCRIANGADCEEVRRGAVVSMLCIQDEETARPSMGQVLLMLEGKTELPAPQIPRSLFTLLDLPRGIEDSHSSSMPSYPPSN